MSTEPETPPDEAPEAAPDGTMPEVGPGLDNLLSALDGMATMGDRLMTPNNRATRRAMKRAKRKKGK